MSKLIRRFSSTLLLARSFDAIRKVVIFRYFRVHERLFRSGILRASSNAEHIMLKITAIDSEHTRTLILEGRLVDPWISELERSWTDAQRAKGTRPIVVDLKDVTAISEGGENLLFQMMAKGARFNCCRGVLTKHVLQQLERRREAQNRKGQDQP